MVESAITKFKNNFPKKTTKNISQNVNYCFLLKTEEDMQNIVFKNRSLIHLHIIDMVASHLNIICIFQGDHCQAKAGMV